MISENFVPSVLHSGQGIYDSAITINMFHPEAPDTFCLYLYQDDSFSLVSINQ
ncbi:hypothetical protein XBJ2_2370005 [Xenorhabdus bovienii str. Jollieti]|nr:hypothetical protein XBJ2_2370005 [Xenorhabdus bovienii str. Jollieti]